MTASQATVSKCMPAGSSSAVADVAHLLKNHVGQIVATDFLAVPAATYRLLFVLVQLAHERRRVVHVAVTPHPTAEWTRQRLREGFPWGTGPRYLLARS
jgi:hypothetical protein